ncbi:MAG: hypothetical protein A3E01_19685 [Gammaproteobacteria bacterium RIFCSPHIGHO2_12_FULL_63_22]|nr:MAG: hypothetical protein A3E01_19685 [Gammaproteobacteria bacterium RIFCSPHIGHO2_12_FULL_63_22]
MIVRRIVEHLKNQHWTSVLIELAIVVLGVFIGLQVDNWNQARGERAAETGYLSGLREDVDYSTDKLQTLIANMERQQVAREKLHAFATDPGMELDPAVRDQLVLHALFLLPQIDISEVTLETLKSSGRLPLIRSPKLVSELQSLSAAVASATRLQADELQVTYLFSDPLLVGDLDMGNVFRQPNLTGKANIAWLEPAPDATPTPEIMKTRKFANVLLYRSFFTEARLVSVRRMLEQHKRIAALIRARQVELGVAPVISARQVEIGPSGTHAGQPASPAGSQ